MTGLGGGGAAEMGRSGRLWVDWERDSGVEDHVPLPGLCLILFPPPAHFLGYRYPPPTHTQLPVISPLDPPSCSVPIAGVFHLHLPGVTSMWHVAAAPNYLFLGSLLCF
jgi:hypothetical protein